jgi:hypothetical protein
MMIGTPITSIGQIETTAATRVVATTVIDNMTTRTLIVITGINNTMKQRPTILPQTHRTEEMEVVEGTITTKVNIIPTNPLRKGVLG